MKRIFTLLFITAVTINIASAQSQQTNRSHNDGLQKVATSADDYNVLTEMNKNQSEGSKWLNYARAAAFVYGSSARIVDIPLFPDTLQRSFGGTFGSIYLHYIAQVLDPTSDLFELENQLDQETINQIYVRDENNYTIDSVMIPIQYLRNIEDFDTKSIGSFKDTTYTYDTVQTMDMTQDSIRTTIQINRDSNYVIVTNTKAVDTAVMEFYSENDGDLPNDRYTASWVPTNYNVDTLRTKRLEYNQASNNLKVANKQIFKRTLDSLTFADSLTAPGTTYGAEGVYFFQVPVGLEMQAGKNMVVGLGFIPGYDGHNKKITEQFDTIASFVATADTIRTWDDVADSIYVIDTVFNITYQITLNSSVVVDTVTSFNSLQFQSFEENSDSYPIYTKGEWNDSYIAFTEDRFGSGIQYLNSRYIFVAAYQTEGHDFFYNVSCNTCFHTSVKENDSKFNLGTSYPNPVLSGSEISTPITIEGSQLVKVELVDALGRVISTFNKQLSGKNLVQVPTNNLRAGIYHLNITVGNQNEARNIVIQ